MEGLFDFKVKNLIKNTILFFLILFFCPTLILCQNTQNPLNWQFSIKWEDVLLSEIPLVDTEIQILDGHANALFLFYKSGNCDEVLLKAEGLIENGKIHLNKWNENISQINGNFAIKDNKLYIGPLTGTLNTVPFDAQAEMDLVSPYPFCANISAKSVFIEEISSFVPFLKDYIAFKSPAEARFDIQGDLLKGPFAIDAFFREMALYSILMKNVKVSFIWLDNEVILRNFQANLEEGKISGEGQIILNTK